MTTYNFAHRGARSLAPENSFAAIRKAWEIGTHGVEVDVRVTRDGELVLHHDLSLQRTTNVADVYPDRSTAPITSFSLAELQRLDNGSWFIDSDPFAQIQAGAITVDDSELFRKARIPSLREILRYIRDKEWRINLELKKLAVPMKQFPLAERVLALIDRERVDRKKVIISSFQHKLLRISQQRAPDIEVNALIGRNRLTGNNWGNFEFEIYNANAAYIDRNQVLAARNKGCRVNLYTVNDLSEMKRFMEWGVETLITDYPQALVQLLADS